MKLFIIQLLFYSLWVSDEESTDKVLCVVRDVLEKFVRKVEVGLGDVEEGLLVILASKGREAGQQNISGYSQGPAKVWDLRLLLETALKEILFYKIGIKICF